MEIKEAIKIIKRLIESVELVYKSNPLTDKEPHPETEALTIAISALEKQEQDKSCETCKHENLTLLQSPCRDCYRSTSMFEDYYEPYTEEES